MFPDITCDDIFRLETERLWLRWLRASDAATVTAIAGAADVAQMTASIPHPYPPGEAERFILHARGATAGGDALVLAVTSKATSQGSSKAKTRSLIGIVSAQAMDRNEIEIGYLIAPSQTRRGYASEAVAALVDAAFNLTHARAVIADSRIDNAASRRVLEKCGFSFVATAPKNLPARGGSHACDFFRFERPDWARARARRLPGMAHQGPRGAPPGHAN